MTTVVVGFTQSFRTDKLIIGYKWTILESKNTCVGMQSSVCSHAYKNLDNSSVYMLELV